MVKNIILKDKEVQYTLKRNSRARKLTLTIKTGGEVAITIPRFAGEKNVERFMKEKADWILTKIEYMKTREKGSLLKKHSKEEYRKFKKSAEELIRNRVEEINKMYSFEYDRITIKNQSTRWGSCSNKNNLNFNYKIALLPRKYTDYIIAHELCHLKEMNHSKNFWNLVAQAVPDYREIRKEIKKL